MISPRLSILLLATLASAALAEGPKPRVHEPAPENRVASVFISEDFLNEQLNAHAKSDLFKEVKLSLDPDLDRIILTGKLQMPLEEMRAINLNPKLGAFRFQLTIQPKITKKGYVVLDFPLSETYFYPATSKDPKRDRVIIPVQLLSLAIASTRGYLAALSGDFSGFDRRTDKLTALLKNVERSISTEKNADALEELKNQRESLRLQLAAVPVERKQLQTAAKSLESVLGFTGENEINLNEEIASRENALIFKLRLSKLTPYLKGAQLGGIRIFHDKKDGDGQNYFAVDMNSELATTAPAGPKAPRAKREGMKRAPALIMRLNQAVFESKDVIEAQSKAMPSGLRDMAFSLKDDGLHVTGSYRTLLVFNVGFETIVDFVSTGPDTFEVRLRKLEAAGLGLDFMSKFVLESMKERLDAALKGICTFKYVGDGVHALQVTVDPKTLVPAFPDLHLVDVDVRDREFLMKVGKL